MSKYTLPTLNVQYSFLDEKHLGAALSGDLALELLVQILPLQSYAQI